MDLSNLLVKEVWVSDKFVKFINTVEKTSSDLSCHFSVDILDREKDRVSDELGLVSFFSEAVEFVQINSWESNLFGLFINWVLLLSRIHHVVSGEVVRVHNRLVLVVTLVTLISSTLVTATSLLIATTTSVVVTSVHVVVSTVLVLVVVSLVPSHVLIWHVMRANNPFFFRSNLSDKFVDLLLSFGGIDVAVLYPLQVILKSVNSISYVVARLLPVEHLGLFTAESFVFKLLLGNPEFNSEGLVGEEIALIKVLDSGLCGLDIVVKDKTLLVGSNLYVGVDSEF
jgi:hypothetical protein